MRWLALTLALLLAGPALAVQPDEVLDDPVLEERARDISAGLRCPVCRNESIDDSSAPVSRDLRLLVRERLVAGDSDREVVAYIVDRYGEYVLLEPTKDGANLILWLAAPALLIAALGIGYGAIRSRASADAPDGLTDDEEARLSELMGKR
ncbi:cytochrome c-type biogenesis protein [Histidinibacterium lentulum]|uniref:Cytochrome c-type biogenesis protein n=1 Tax=Histidinibacterium lentulum TaxID=2480588 RepID=A0A3N2QKX9_9RHOB|nr:cytochrome c-type biogenesis protein [Histidinibacterium lentulum]ROT95851.1 cytochrome c-type biogenesis protein CcmH [Histidinibacterium lentulum]